MIESSDKKTEEIGLKNSFRNTRFRNERNFFSSLNNEQRFILTTAKKSESKAKPSAKIKIYNCGHKTSLPGKLMKSNSKDRDYKNVKTGVKQTWDFYHKLFGRNSIDDLGMVLTNSIHYSEKYSNAMWDGKQMSYGDGDGKYTLSFTEDIDIIGHELTHGVVQFSANLDYEFQSGALNESFADIFGIMIKQKAMNLDVKKSNWLIGENILKGNQFAVRSLKRPGSAYKNHKLFGDDPQPATMDKFEKLPNTKAGDYGGVHINSGIPNFAFYVTAFNIGGNSWEKAGRIWYGALTELLKENSDFKDAKNSTIKKATQIFGKGSLEEKAVKAGWKEAKV
ncbi:MAG TPA: M4 family metallopeptidase [Ignavibacteria bacterium]|nr:M4 family metallopeptidase [Ignavibacteria bacterium]